MGIIEYTIIGALAGACVWLVATIFKGKNAKKAIKAKQEKPKEEPKKEEEKKTEPDRSFKIVKKSRLSRVSKKALETNARTATIEKVFERTPPMPTQTNQDIYVEPLEPASQQLLDALEGVDAQNRKVVSIGELKRQAGQSAQDIYTSYYPDPTEEYSSEKYLSKGRAGEVTGEYTGIHLGSGKRSYTNPKAVPDFDKAKLTDDNVMDIEQLLGKDAVDKSAPWGMQRNPFMRQPEFYQEQSSDDIDFSDVVVAEALLNPKFKQKKQKHVRFKK